MNAMVPGLGGGKMSSSDPNSKIDFLDTPDVIKRKIKAAFCEEGNVDENGLLSFTEAVLIPISQLRMDRIKGDSVLEDIPDGKPFITDDAPDGTVFSIYRDAKWGGSLHFSTHEDLKQAFKDKLIHPGDLKNAVTNVLVQILTPIRKQFEENEEWQKIADLAYPSEAKPAKKKKVRMVHLKGCSCS